MFPYISCSRTAVLPTPAIPQTTTLDVFPIFGSLGALTCNFLTLSRLRKSLRPEKTKLLEWHRSYALARTFQFKASTSLPRRNNLGFVKNPIDLRFLLQLGLKPSILIECTNLKSLESV